jgi:hypothetical protein
MRGILLIAVMVVAGMVSASLGKPYPAGTCAASALDDGVATAANPPPLRGSVQNGDFTDADPRIISMNLPRGGASVLDFSNGAVIVDSRFRIKSDGTATTPDVLCARPQATQLSAELVSSAPQWRFEPMKLAGQPVDSQASYRIIVNATPPTVNRIPLAFRAN